MEARRNNFDAMRIIAATAVVLSHAVPLTYGTNELEPLWHFSRGQATFGTIAVVVFFVISGYLITRSFMASSSVWRFMGARVLRLYPGLTVALVLTAFVLGPCLTSLPAREYFASSEPFVFVMDCLALRNGPAGLPGVFDDNPIAHVVNGSLWTLRYEVECYLLVILVGISGLLNRWVLAALWMASLAASALWLTGIRFNFVAAFMGGAVFAAWRPPLRGWLALTCLAIWVAGMATPGERLISATAGAYVIMYVGLAPRVRLPGLARWGDCSYGIYIYAFPIQQAVAAALGPAGTWYWNAAISLPVVTALAYLSWHTVERPALALKPSRRVGPVQPAQ